MADQNRNGHLSRFEDFSPIKRSIEEIVDDAIAFKKGESRSEPAPTIVASFDTVDLVRYRLNSKALYDAYLAMGDKHSDPHDEDSYADRSARFGVIDRESGQPLAMLWAVGRKRDGQYEICLPSFSKTKKLEQDEFLQVMRELDIPPSRRNGESEDFASRYDIWHEDGEWIAKEPRHLAVYQFESTCYSTVPPMKDTVSIFVPIDPAMPLDGNGDSRAACEADDHYRSLAQQKFWSSSREVQSARSSWMGFGDPMIVKVTGRRLYNEFWPSNAPAQEEQPSASP